MYLADVLAGVGQGDLVDLVGVEPDLALSALEHGGGKPLLELERHLLFVLIVEWVKSIQGKEMAQRQRREANIPRHRERLANERRKARISPTPTSRVASASILRSLFLTTRTDPLLPPIESDTLVHAFGKYVKVINRSRGQQPSEAGLETPTKPTQTTLLCKLTLA